PFLRMVSMFSGQKSIRVTSSPVWASHPPTYPPSAPTPTTAIRLPILSSSRVRPHPEERPGGPRLEGWERVCCPCFKTAATRPPQHEVMVVLPKMPRPPD